MCLALVSLYESVRDYSSAGQVLLRYGSGRHGCFKAKVRYYKLLFMKRDLANLRFFTEVDAVLFASCLELYVLRVRLELAVGNLRVGMTLLDRGIEKFPWSSALMILLLHHGEKEKVRSISVRALARNDLDWKGLRCVGYIMWRESSFDIAREALVKCLDSNPIDISS